MHSGRWPRRALDNGGGLHKMGLILAFAMEPPCNHERTDFLARRDGVDYVQCALCRQIFEAEDLETVSVDDEEDQER